MQNPKTAFSKPALRSFLLRGALPALLAAAAGFFARCQLEISDGVPAEYLAGQWPLYAPLNALTAFCVTLVLFAVFQKWSRATGVSGAVFTVLALINYYTRDLHGSALMPQDVLNLGTAAEVMGSYTLQITPSVLCIVALYLPVLALAWVQGRLAAGRPKTGWRKTPRRAAGRAAASAACAGLILYAGYFSPFAPGPKTPCGWNWQETYYTRGYLAGTVEAFRLLSDPVIRPEGYSDAAAQAAADGAAAYRPAATAAESDRPDIILILSESFYDVSLVTDPQADVPYLSVTQSLQNAVTGHAVAPNVGGGTNSSEYELLTSNSLMLAPSVTPFNWLKLEGANALPGYLKSLGYSTLAAHPYTSSNYRRDTAWAALGFDETHFADSFPTKEQYGSRPYQTDAATYRDLAALYEAMPEDTPRFAFLVSIQSHGDYDMNDASLDLVHAGTDYGRYDAVVDEYLSCMYLSDAAVGDLTDYFTRVYDETGRRVVVCMVGDHAPSFIDHIADHTIPETQRQILERSTPFFIWANYPLETAGQQNEADPLNRMDLCALAPTLVEQAGLPLSPYYRYILNMKATVPLVTAGSDYMLADGATARFGQNADADALVYGYFALEYNNIGANAVRQNALFAPAR